MFTHIHQPLALALTINCAMEDANMLGKVAYSIWCDSDNPLEREQLEHTMDTAQARYDVLHDAQEALTAITFLKN